MSSWKRSIVTLPCSHSRAFRSAKSKQDLIRHSLQPFDFKDILQHTGCGVAAKASKGTRQYPTICHWASGAKNVMAAFVLSNTACKRSQTHFKKQMDDQVFQAGVQQIQDKVQALTDLAKRLKIRSPAKLLAAARGKIAGATFRTCKSCLGI